MKDWMASGLSALDLLVMQIDGIRIDEDLILVAAGAEAVHPIRSECGRRARDERMARAMTDFFVAPQREVPE